MHSKLYRHNKYKIKILLRNVHDLSEEITKSELEDIKDILNKFVLGWED